MGSPRSNGRCAHLAEMLFEACIDECPEDELFLVPVSELDIAPCIGCGACRATATLPVSRPEDNPADAANEEGAAEPAASKPDKPIDSTAEPKDADNDAPDYPYCPRYDDDMQDVYPLLPAADELIVVSPVYFSGAPSSLKALLDRMQPHFWAGTRQAPKRPATLHIVGEGGDPHGHDALISEVRSSLSCAGFRLERALDWVGKISADGEIEDEATEIPLVEKQSLVSAADAPATEPERAATKERPKLDLGGRSAQHKGAAKGGKDAQSRNASKRGREQGGSSGKRSQDGKGKGRRRG